MEINKIHNMDCFEGLKQLKEKSVDLMIIDPPYSTPVITSFGRKKIKNLADLSIQEVYFKQLKKHIGRVLKDDGRLFIFCDPFVILLLILFYF